MLGPVAPWRRAAGGPADVGPTAPTDARHDARDGSPDDAPDPRRVRRLQAVGVWSGLTAGAWLGAAEAPTKLVTAGISPIIVSFTMVLGVFLARWSVPALVQGTRHLRADVRQAPHLLVWAVLGGCLWAVANTLTVFAIRDVGLSIAFPLWNTNSVLGILWGVVLFSELRDASATRWLGVVGGAVVMFVAAILVASASATQATPANAVRGVVAALTAGALWGTMYIPYRKAYLTGMSPLSFLTFFTVGEVVTMTALALGDAGGIGPLARELARVHGALFWLFAGGFVWVVGDIFQQYAAKYVGISRGIPLSNTNQLWGLLWGVLVFGELRGQPAPVYARVVGGSALMALGALAIALASAGAREHARWRGAAAREGARYGVDAEYTRSRGLGTSTGVAESGRTWMDLLLVGVASAMFLALGSIAAAPHITVHTGWAAALAGVLVASLTACGYLIWRTTRFV
jgi:drug/metabolite transporter (DMT)-like permease